jgi:hypothetical protein
MMHDVIENRKRVSNMLKNMVDDFVTMRSSGDAHFISMPIFYPDNTPVTIKIEPMTSSSLYFVSDGGFGFHEVESIGYENSFTKTAKKYAEEYDLEVEKGIIFSKVEEAYLYRTICDIAKISWQTVSKIYKNAEKDEVIFEQELRARLFKIFGSEKVSQEHVIMGSSSVDWNVTGIVNVNGHLAVFLAVSEHSASINKASAAFHDIAALEDNPPILISVVKDKKALGKKLALLSHTSKVIDEGQSDDVFKRAANY